MSNFNEMKISVYPNPSNGIFNILLDGRFTNKGGELTIFSPTGSVVFSEQISEKKNYQVDIRSLANGIYFLKIHENGRLFVKKLCKFT